MLNSVPRIGKVPLSASRYGRINGDLLPPFGTTTLLAGLAANTEIPA